MLGSVILALTMVHRPEEAKNIDIYIYLFIFHRYQWKMVNSCTTCRYCSIHIEIEIKYWHDFII
jgi:hypothetical protein